MRMAVARLPGTGLHFSLLLCLLPALSSPSRGFHPPTHAGPSLPHRSLQLSPRASLPRTSLHLASQIHPQTCTFHPSKTHHSLHHAFRPSHHLHHLARLPLRRAYAPQRGLTRGRSAPPLHARRPQALRSAYRPRPNFINVPAEKIPGYEIFQLHEVIPRKPEVIHYIASPKTVQERTLKREADEESKSSVEDEKQPRKAAVKEEKNYSKAATKGQKLHSKAVSLVIDVSK